VFTPDAVIGLLNYANVAVIATFTGQCDVVHAEATELIARLPGLALAAGAGDPGHPGRFAKGPAAGKLLYHLKPNWSLQGDLTCRNRTADFALRCRT
jgi:hypothetical protein